MFPTRQATCLTIALLIAGQSFAEEPAAQQSAQQVAESKEPMSPDAGADTEQGCEPIPEFGTFEACPSRPMFAETLVGRYRSTSGIGPKIPQFDYVPVAFRLGCGPADEGGFFRRHASFLAECTVDPVTGSFGNIVTGASVMARFDVCPQQRICPYFQGGTGFVLTDAYRDETQRAIGQEFEFLQQLEVGIRCKLTDSLAIESEFGLQHISNGGLATRNFGVNAIGASIGLRWTFGAGHERY
jgi:Lipid A 3-O-deacylase (PagL)